MRRRRLHFQIFRALVLTGVLCLLVTGLVAKLFRSDDERWPQLVQDVGAFIVADLPEHDPVARERELRDRAARLRASISLWERDGKLLVRVGKELGPTWHRGAPKHDLFAHHGAFEIRLRDGRTLALAFDGQPTPPGARHFVFAGALLFGTLLLGSYMAARRITRRLEGLERGVTRFAAGDLEARVKVRGRDEIASLAHAFNRSFDRIAGLLRQQRRMLQSASHELRSPLARVRMALELATEPEQSSDGRERLRREATRDIEELDALIGDLLLAGRLADTELPREFAAVALQPIVREEAARVSAAVEGAELSVLGNGRMLRSLVRNLLENARRYGRDPIRAMLSLQGNEAVLRVEDAGDGVVESERERIFEPFYRPAGHREGVDGGVGLGLALVKTIAEHHGGTVRYVAGASGSCFEVRLPL
jgi:signal transduction histidine kinase